MIKRHLILLGLLISISLLLVAGWQYPGGTPADSTTQGYSFTENYISNLLDEQALNGMENKARPWAIAGVLFSSLTFGLFFIGFSQRIMLRAAAVVIKWAGVALTVLAFLVVVPSLHDIIVVISFIVTLVVFFYITVMALKSKPVFLKVVSVFFLVFHYFVAYMYFTRTQLDVMPALQKLIHVFQIIWILSLHYGTKEEDFAHITK